MQSSNPAVEGNPKRRFFRRKEAAEYVRMKHNVPCSSGYLAKLAVIGGGPKFRKMGRIVLYEPPHLDEWVEPRISEIFSSTSEYPHAA